MKDFSSEMKNRVCVFPSRVDPVAVVQAVLTIARSNPEIATRLAQAGYNRTEVEVGLDLYRQVQQALTERQQKLEQFEQAEAYFQQTETEARQAFNTFRQAARLVFKHSATFIQLGLEGPVPEDLTKFQIMAQASYEAACSPHYCRRIEPHFSMPDAIATLENLTAAEARRNQACDELTRATELWDSLAVFLDEWATRCFQAAQTRLGLHFLNSLG